MLPQAESWAYFFINYNSSCTYQGLFHRNRSRVRINAAARKQCGSRCPTITAAAIASRDAERWQASWRVDRDVGPRSVGNSVPAVVKLAVYFWGIVLGDAPWRGLRRLFLPLLKGDAAAAALLHGGDCRSMHQTMGRSHQIRKGIETELIVAISLGASHSIICSGIR